MFKWCNPMAGTSNTASVPSRQAADQGGARWNRAPQIATSYSPSRRSRERNFPGSNETTCWILKRISLRALLHTLTAPFCPPKCNERASFPSYLDCLLPFYFCPPRYSNVQPSKNYQQHMQLLETTRNYVKLSDTKWLCRLAKKEINKCTQ